MNTAILDLNKTTGKWEASFNGEVIVSGGYRKYVVDRILNQAGNAVRAAKVSEFIDISEYDADMRAAIIKNHQPDAETTANTGNSVQSEPQEPAITFNINERFDFVADFVRMVGNRENASAIIVGTGGLGKSHITLQTLINDCKLVETDSTAYTGEIPEPDGPVIENVAERLEAMNEQLMEEQRGTFLVVKGYTTAKGLYRTLYENRNRIVVFDDCDAALLNTTSQALLKAALDSYDRRVITWNAEASFGEALPKSFEFTGGIVFISNMSMSQIPQAIVSRSLVADVSMTRKEAVSRMRIITSDKGFMVGYDNKIKQMALDFIDVNIHRQEVADVNMRTLMSVIKIIKANPTNWERRALYTMCSAK